MYSRGTVAVPSIDELRAQAAPAAESSRPTRISNGSRPSSRSSCRRSRSSSGSSRPRPYRQGSSSPAAGLSVAALAGRLRAGELSPREAVAFYLERIERLDPAVNAYITVLGEEALAEAARLERDGGDEGAALGRSGRCEGRDRRRRRADDGRLEGARRQSSRTRTRPSSSACATAGAIVLGKLNTHELAYGAFTTSEAFGPAHNPWQLDRICGGSSGGSGAAAASPSLPRARSGPTRQARSGSPPASAARRACARRRAGSRTGESSPWPAASTPSGRSRGRPRTARCCSRRSPGATRTIPRQSTGRCPGTAASSTASLSGLRIGVVTELFERGIDSRVAAVVQAAVDELRAAGARILEVEIPLLSSFGTIQQAMQFAEATEANLGLLRTSLADLGARRPRPAAQRPVPPLDDLCPRAARAAARVPADRARVRGRRPARCADDAGAAAPDRRGHRHDRHGHRPVPAGAHSLQLGLELRWHTRQ